MYVTSPKHELKHGSFQISYNPILLITKYWVHKPLALLVTSPEVHKVGLHTYTDVIELILYNYSVFCEGIVSSTMKFIRWFRRKKTLFVPDYCVS